AGESLAMTIDAVAVAPGEAINTVSLTVEDFEADAESPAVTIGKPAVDLKISKTSNGVEIYQGSEFDYIILVENVGTADAEVVQVRDNLPSGLTYISSSFSASSTEIEPTGTTNGSQLIWDISSFPAGETLTITIKVKADLPGVKTNRAEVTAGEQEELNPGDKIGRAHV